jgi:hypothetical protein
MRHAWWLLALVAIGCSSSSGAKGEPQNGDVMLTVGGDMPDLADGAAIPDRSMPGNLVIELGTASVNCSIDITAPAFSVASGDYVWFSVSQTALATNTTNQVTVMKVSGTSLTADSTSGTVTTTALGARVTGSVTFANVFSTSLGAITLSGNFDVKNCSPGAATGQ